jgi:NADH:ubiquinone oxidoreductase subunit E
LTTTVDIREQLRELIAPLRGREIEKETTADGKFSLESVRCFGSCALAPVVVVDDDVYGNVTGPGSVDILKKYR